MSLSQFPVELLQEILAYVLHEHAHPSAVLCVNRPFFELGQPLLHTHLRFRSITQLSIFAKGTAPLACPPKSLVITLAGGEADFEVFKHLKGALQRCICSISIPTNDPGRGSEDFTRTVDEMDDVDNATPAAQVPLEVLALRLHSHSRNSHLSYIYEALSLANPRTFVWKGPDPEHHFSTATVPSATYHLIRAVSTWSAIEHITLTNMSFPSDELGRNTPFARDAPVLPPLPTLRTLYIGQATLLPPDAVAAMIARPGQDALERVRLVDTYRHSSWGPRIRLKDIEDAVGSLRQVVGEERRAEVVERVRRLVRCEKKTERLMGGDIEDEEVMLH